MGMPCKPAVQIDIVDQLSRKGRLCLKSQHSVSSRHSAFCVSSRERALLRRAQSSFASCAARGWVTTIPIWWNLLRDRLYARAMLARCFLTAWRRSKYKRVSRSSQHLTNFEMTDGQWESLLIPINMAFLFRSSIEGRMIALYPSPAGAVESLLPLEAWSEIVDQNPVLYRLQARHRGTAREPCRPRAWREQSGVFHRADR